MKFINHKEDQFKSGIYIISNSIDKRVYIGSATKFINRFRDHKSCFNLNKHNRRFQNFVNKYGIQKLEFKMLEQVLDLNLLLLREQFYINYYQSFKSIKGFNICPIAGSLLGTKMPKSHKEKSSKRMINNQIAKGRKATEEQKEYLRKAQKTYWKNNPDKLRDKKLNSSKKLKGMPKYRTFLIKKDEILIEEIKSSIKQVALNYNTNTTDLSKVLNGHRKDINGFSFEYKEKFTAS